MANDKKISYLRMEPASNGVIISYDETKKSPNKDTYSNSFCESKKEVFDIDVKNDEDFETAFARFKELWKQAYLDK